MIHDLGLHNAFIRTNISVEEDVYWIQIEKIGTFMRDLKPQISDLLFFTNPEGSPMVIVGSYGSYQISFNTCVVE